MVGLELLGALTCSHCDSGMRSPWPEKADLSYCGMPVGWFLKREEKTESARGMSWVEGGPRCWRRGLSGCDWARETWSACVR
jgi:hypothetical protein